MFTYHRTVTSGLQTVTRLSRLSPHAAVIQVSVERVEAVVQKQAKRYPTITATDSMRSVLRRAGLPALHLVIMPPEATGQVTLILLSNMDPTGGNEAWFPALDEAAPLTWRNYELALNEERITWRLSGKIREHYRARLARLITGRSGIPVSGQRPYQLPPATARTQVIKLATHLRLYPGFSGIRRDVFDLAQYSTRVWKSTHPREPYPEWPRMPALRFQPPALSPLRDIQSHFTSLEEPAREQEVEEGSAQQE